MEEDYFNTRRTGDRYHNGERSSAASSAGTTLSNELSDEPRYYAPFRYTPLESSSSSIRLVVLQPTNGVRNSVPSCRIFHTTFAEKPVYEALSYTWGDDSIKSNIILNGCDFEVSRNLFEALVGLRSLNAGRILWIDALCINQIDTDERNSQLRLMPLAYKRADCVLAWLGYGRNSSDFVQREYWRRVWVVHEIGKARRLKVCFAEMVYRNELVWKRKTMTWDDFVASNTSNKFPGAKNPLDKFIKLRRTRYGESTILRNLLEDHQEAECKDIRDKVYALVGLSVDASDRLPLDYRKSLWEIYVDFLLLYNRDRELMDLNKLLRTTIGSPDRLTTQVLQGEEASIASLQPIEQKAFRIELPSAMLGPIIYLGPTYEDIISMPEKTFEWDKAVERYACCTQPEIKREQSDLFLEALERADGDDLKRLSSKRCPSGHIFMSKWSQESVEFGEYPEEDTEPRGVPNLDSNVTQPAHCSQFPLFIVGVDGCCPENGIGIACPEARKGDLICRIHHHDLAVVLRQHDDRYRLVGFAGLAMTPQDVKHLKETSREHRTPLFDFAHIEFHTDERRWGYEFMLYLDIITFFEMSNDCPGQW
jgi:hypothetical protein